MRKAYKIAIGNLNGKGHLAELCVVRRIVVKWLLNGVDMRTGFRIGFNGRPL
jgi:hypothetical protein